MRRNKKKQRVIGILAGVFEKFHHYQPSESTSLEWGEAEHIPHCLSSLSLVKRVTRSQATSS